MTLRTRLVLSIGGIALLVVLPALYGASQLARLRDIAEDLHGRHAAAFLALGRLQASLADLDRNERSFIATPTPQARTGMDQSLAQARGELGRLDDAGYASATRSIRARLAALEGSTHRIEGLMS